MKIKDDIYFMNLALKEAKKAYNNDEVPVGAVLVINNQVVSRGYNNRQKNKDVLGHAEIIAIKKATKKLDAWILEGATLYVTLEPCLMCAGAILNARIKKLVYATPEPKFGVIESVTNVLDNPKFNHIVEIEKGVLQEESSTILKSFFKEIRSNKNN